jgi:tetratricopeptide (TPR) repeat protein
MHTRALRNWERGFGRDHPLVAWALSGLAESRASQGRHHQAVRNYERALRIRERAFGPRHTRVARTLTTLASSLVSLGQITRADTLAARAVAIWEEAKAPDGLTEALLVKARIEARRGHAEAAHAAYERVLAVRLPLFGGAHPTIAEAEAGLASSLAVLGRRADALEAALRAERIGRNHLRLTAGGLSEGQALAYAASRPRGLDLAVSLTGDPLSPVPVYDALIRSRAVVLDEMATRQRLRERATDTRLGPLWSELASARQKLANLAVRGPADDSAARYATELDQARREKERLEAALADANAELRQELVRPEVGFEDVLRALPPRSAVVSFVRFQPTSTAAAAYMAFVLRAGQDAPATVSLGGAAGIEHAVRRWRQQLPRGLQPDGTMVATAEAALRGTGHALRRRVWDPLAPHLGDVERVFVVPEADVNLIAFAALPRAGGGYLVDAPYSVHYLSAERDLLAFAGRPRATGRGLLSVGGPAYGVTRSQAAMRLTTRGVSVVGTTAARAECITLQSIAFDDLPASAREAADVAALWRRYDAAGADDGNAVATLVGAAATEGTFKRSGAGRRVLHIATHGFFLDARCQPGPTRSGPTATGAATGGMQTSAFLSRSPLVFSGLALAGANRRHAERRNADDGILTAEEVVALDLDGVEWAVLSACDTGLGTIKTGEGVFGLRRAFEIAGARTVIMSLWSVEDRASRAWMRALYEGRLRDGLSTTDAVREASRAVLRDRRAKKLGTHPFFWAGFVAAGDWR